ncbi:ParB/Srx family N-terminal domain-containing protein [Lusitaniella coriacea]|uniref:ParB/Srx family N-terminal domain-containing protein n=1 Tax=Lusitaniella coriacea TaxID=1983105 RepID=UPI003CECE3A6
MPNADEGRLKWWRKKAMEGSLPPILVWYLSCLDAYVIVDGHSRLLAAYLESEVPEFIAVYAANEIQMPPRDEARQEKIMASLAHQKKLKAHKPISTEQINAVLIQAFDNRPYLRTRTRAWARIKSDEEWKQEVESFLQIIGKTESGKIMLE